MFTFKAPQLFAQIIGEDISVKKGTLVMISSFEREDAIIVKRNLSNECKDVFDSQTATQTKMVNCVLSESGHVFVDGLVVYASFKLFMENLPLSYFKDSIVIIDLGDHDFWDKPTLRRVRTDIASISAITFVHAGLTKPFQMEDWKELDDVKWMALLKDQYLFTGRYRSNQALDQEVDLEINACTNPHTGQIHFLRGKFRTAEILTAQPFNIHIGIKQQGGVKHD